MPPTTLVRSGRWLRLLGPSGAVLAEARLSESPEASAAMSAGAFDLPDRIRQGLSSVSAPEAVAAADPGLVAVLARAGRRSVLLGGESLRWFRDRGWVRDPEERRFLLGLARARLRQALASPDEILAALAREEERLERAERREENAAQSWVAEGAAPLGEYARASGEFRQVLSTHHAELVGQLESEARRAVPNLSALVGPLVAARLVAAAGGRELLARMTAARFQLLGARRRFGPGRNPRFGILFRAVGMGDVPPARSGAYARSLAALAAIAIRADSITRRSIAPELVRRRDRRIEWLRRPHR